ncbi:MAG: ATP-binding cassette domain-containing protein, partial [Spirochaetes bacterium]|nr:ATP-binding cassette domain-containing protein [Spirochaetota bacterium]
MCPIPTCGFTRDIKEQLVNGINKPWRQTVEYVLECEKVAKNYTLGDTVVHALKGVNVRIKKGAFTAIVGPSGSGKSTLLHLAAG